MKNLFSPLALVALIAATSGIASASPSAPAPSAKISAKTKLVRLAAIARPQDLSDEETSAGYATDDAEQRGGFVPNLADCTVKCGVACLASTLATPECMLVCIPLCMAGKHFGIIDQETPTFQEPGLVDEGDFAIASASLDID